MKFSEQWLREWVDPAVSTEELAHQLTMAGLEVDAIDPAAADFAGVVVGAVVRVEPHPDADKLRVCQVDIGEAEPLPIVCGAANVHEGMRAPTAVVGARLPGDFKIKKAKLRGVESRGMLCSASELGLAESASGLLPLPADAPIGRDLREYMGLDDAIIELGLTPNRGDCLSIAGIARETGVLNGCDVKGPRIEPVAAAVDRTFPVRLEAAADCPRYVGRVIEGVDVQAATPLWMQERLRRCGIRSLGPVVDVTNYVLLELGQPMHAFDLAKLAGSVQVRRGRPGEQLQLLNDETVELDSDTLVIADDNGPLALAGIMGGAASAVGDTTRDIFLESAFFSPEAIVGKARRYGLHTDSSHRFERGVSATLQREAVERATALLVAIAGGRPGPVIEQVAAEHLPCRAPVALRAERLRRVLGVEIAAERVSEILQRLGFTVEASADGWHATPPPYRFDIGIEVDLIEEIGRIHGYENIPSATPIGGLVMQPQPEERVARGAVRSALVERGYQETISYSFVDPKIQVQLHPGEEGIALANPLSSELSVMRLSLWSGLIAGLQHNVNRQQRRVRMFELGLRFRREGGETRQIPTCGGIAYGARRPEQWGEAEQQVDFFDVKGDVEALLELAGVRGACRFRPESHPALHPGQSARIYLNERPVGWLGTLHPALERAFDLSGRAVLFELDQALFEQRPVPNFSELSKFPAIRRDIAVVVDDSVPAQSLYDVILEAAPEELRKLELFDVYTGKGVDSGRKSVALGLTLQAPSRTLKDVEVEQIISKIVDTLKVRTGAELR